MTIENCITDNIPCIRPYDTVATVLELMEREKRSFLPLVEDGKLVGWLNESNLLDADDEMSAYQIASHDEIPAVICDLPITSVVSTMLIYSIDIVPIIDKQNNYMGCATAQTIVESLSILLGATTVGKVIAIKLNMADYSLTRIVNIIEENNAKIYSITTNIVSGNDSIEIYAKLDINETGNIISSLARYGYEAWELGLSTDNDDNVIVRNYNSLMQYLKIDN